MRPKAYYNENDKFAAAWLRELIKANLIADGDVDDRSIEDVRPADLAGYTQCHWFAGIGGWSYALRLAGWPDEREVWTGSCPCQPFSSAGKANGADDPRHLWPTWFQLIHERRPDTVFGEQVSSADGLGWFDLVSTDLEAEGYAVGALDAGAASVGAPHIRQRLWFVADANKAGLDRVRSARLPKDLDASSRNDVDGRGQSGVMGDTANARRTQWGPKRFQSSEKAQRGPATSNPWTPCESIQCRDGKARPIEPGTFPLAYGIPERLGRLRGYGNAIVPELAAQVIGSYMDCASPRSPQGAR